MAAAPTRPVRRPGTAFVLAGAAVAPGVLLHLGGVHPEPVTAAIAFGLAVVGAAFMLAWAAEAVQVSKDKPEVGEPIRLRAILTGTGNLDRLITPEIPSSEQWDILPAQERRRHSEE